MTANVADNLKSVLNLIPKTVQLVAVSKYHTAEDIAAAYQCGQRIFGESHVQELEKKQATLPKDIIWHFIGHLQTNKVKYIAPYINLIETVDSFKLLKEINKQALKNNRIIDVLLELHIAQEETKYGFTIDACRKMLTEEDWKSLKNIRICGLMMMASHVDNQDQIEQEFMTAANFFDELKEGIFAYDANFCKRSWGMSHDYKIAVKCKSNMVRIGTAIFGPANLSI